MKWSSFLPETREMTIVIRRPIFSIPIHAKA